MDSIIIKGVDCHIGSQITEIGPFTDAITKLLKMIDTLTLMGIEIDHLDIGGGIGITRLLSAFDKTSSSYTDRWIKAFTSDTSTPK